MLHTTLTITLVLFISRAANIQTRVVTRFEFSSEDIQWADIIFTAGGDGTFLLAASKVLDKSKPVIGINTDPDR